MSNTNIARYMKGKRDEEARATKERSTDNFVEQTVGDQAFLNSRLPPPWIAPSLLNSWVNYGGGYEDAGYYKDNFGVVHIRGLIKNGTTTNGTDLFTLPVGYRPVGYNIMATNTNPGSHANIHLQPGGIVEIFGSGVSATWLSLNNLSFRTV